MHAQVEAQLRELAELCPTVFLEDKQWEKLYRVSLSIHTHGGLGDHKWSSDFFSITDVACKRRAS